MTIVDNYYLSSKNEYHENHYMHLIMVNGFDIENKCFYSMGFDGYKYKESVLGFDDFYKAITSSAGNNARIRDDMCMLYKLQEENELEYLRENFNYFPYKFNLGLVRRSLQEYLNSVCSDEHFDCFYEMPRKSKYGITYYEAMAEYVQKYIDGIYEGNLNKIPFHGMLEHKLVMVQRLRYMQDKNYIYDIDNAVKIYEILAYKAEVIRNLVLKYNIVGNLSLLIRVNKELIEMYDIEKKVVEELINLLEKPF